MTDTVSPAWKDEDNLLWRNTRVFRDVYARYWSEVSRFVARRYGDGPPDPEDIAQIAFFRMGQLPSHQAIDNPKALLFRIASNAALDARRQLARQSAHLRAAVALPDNDAAADAERSLIGRETLDLLEQVIVGLPERHRRFFLANRLHGMTYAEISRRTGASQSLVRKTVEEALAACERSVNQGLPDYRGLSRERSRKS